MNFVVSRDADVRALKHEAEYYNVGPLGMHLEIKL